jgi:FlaA1/EpsC-like NDP-sugar epimerase
MIFIIGEGALIFLAVALAAFFLLWRDIGFVIMLDIIWRKALLVSIIAQLSLYFNDLYEFKTTDSGIDVFSRLIRSIGITSIALGIIYFLWPDMIIGKWIFFASLIFLLLFLLSWRLLYSLVIKKKLFAEKTIILGSDGLARDILNGIHTRKDLSYNISSVIAHNRNQDTKDQFKRISVHHGFDNICDLAEAENARCVIVALDEKRGILPYDELLECKLRGINIIDGESFYERITGKLLVEKIIPSLLVLLSPLILLIAIAIKLDSRGPIFFPQERVGEYGKIFTLYKFRSMRADAEKNLGPYGHLKMIRGLQGWVESSESFE